MTASRKARGGVSFLTAQERETQMALCDIGLGIALTLALSALLTVGALHAFAWILQEAARHVR